MMEGLYVESSLRVSSTYQRNQTRTRRDPKGALVYISEQKHPTYWLLSSSNGLA